MILGDIQIGKMYELQTTVFGQYDTGSTVGHYNLHKGDVIMYLGCYNSLSLKNRHHLLCSDGQIVLTHWIVVNVKQFEEKGPMQKFIKWTSEPHIIGAWPDAKGILKRVA